MQVGKLVFHSEFGRGLIGKVSPSKSLIMVNFKHFGSRTVLSGSLIVLS